METGHFILCIDNEKRVREAMSVLLGGWGCRVATAASQAEALVEQGAGGLEQDRVLPPVDGERDEEGGEDEQVSADEHPQPFLSGYVAGASALGTLRHHSPARAPRLMAPSMAKIIALNQMPNTTAGIQKASAPFHANGPTLNSPTARPGSSSTPVHKFM